MKQSVRISLQVNRNFSKILKTPNQQTIKRNKVRTKLLKEQSSTKLSKEQSNTKLSKEQSQNQTQNCITVELYQQQPRNQNLIKISENVCKKIGIQAVVIKANSTNRQSVAITVNSTNRQSVVITANSTNKQ